MKTLFIKITEALFMGIFSIVIMLPLNIVYSFGVGAFSFGQSLLQDMDELINYNKSIWK